VSAPHKLSATALTILSCSALTGLTAATAAASSSSAHAPAARSAQLRCTKGSTTRASGRHRASRSCRDHEHTTHAKAPKAPPTLRTHPTRQRHTRGSTTTSPAATEPSPTPTAQTSATAHAATIAAELSTPCQNTELTPEAGNIPLVRAAVLCLINRKRAEDGEQPLGANARLEQAAEGHCQELIADDYFAHVSPSGETPVDRIREMGYIPNANVGYVIGENLAWGTYQLSTPQSIVAAWIASPGHLANILESQYTETGIGITPAVPASLGDGAPGATYAQEFGVIVE
jgi:uncharacterized protein YkwD